MPPLLKIDSMKSSVPAKFDCIDKALSELQLGRPIILVDDVDRENEGDLVVAAEKITPELITLMTREASGIISVPMTGLRLQELNLDLMVIKNQESMRTAFTVTVDSKLGIGTGSSAVDRAITIKKLADPSSTADDFVRPGHVNPIRARDGGLKERAGHTEAAIELIRLAGMQEVAVICEIMNDNGQMSSSEELLAYAKKRQFSIISVQSLVD